VKSEVTLQHGPTQSFELFINTSEIFSILLRDSGQILLYSLSHKMVSGLISFLKPLVNFANNLKPSIFALPEFGFAGEPHCSTSCVIQFYSKALNQLISLVWGISD
jgi:hypothetical protein